VKSKVLLVVGLICLLIGGVWTLQGTGVIGGSFMSNSRTWLVIGLLVAIAGIVCLFEGSRALRKRT
jgi:hypothetical protein